MPWTWVARAVVNIGKMDFLYAYRYPVYGVYKAYVGAFVYFNQTPSNICQVSGADLKQWIKLGWKCQYQM